ncbi:MAG: hypothetical protein M1826_002102 [Phylliscum demangeonii]|nr:MAG: hypothetical protein M1826_002102 [Phylliscum demangeonii]
MKSWIPCVIAFAQLFGPVWARPDMYQRIDGSSARGFGNDKNNHNGETDGDAVRVSKTGVVLGGSALLGAGVLGGAGLRQRRINKLQDKLRQKQPDPYLKIPLLSSEGAEHWGLWKSDAVWMECIYDYLEVPEGGIWGVDAWLLADAISDCGKRHSRHVDLHWFDDLHEGRMTKVTRSTDRKTAWAKTDGQGKEVRAAAPPGRGHFRDQSQTSQFSMGPLSAVVPQWAKRLGINAEHMFAGVAANTRRLSAVNRRVLQKEATILKEEAVAGY